MKKRLSYIEVDTPGVRICLFPELSLQKEKKQQLHQLVAPFAKIGEKLIVIEGNIRTYVTPEMRSFLPSHNSLYFFYYHFLGFNLRHFSATHKRSWPQVAKPSEKEAFKVPIE